MIVLFLNKDCCWFFVSPCLLEGVKKKSGGGVCVPLVRKQTKSGGRGRGRMHEERAKSAVPARERTKSSDGCDFEGSTIV